MDTTNLSMEEQAFLKKYRKDVESLPVYSDEQITEMIEAVAKGNIDKKTQLLSAMLSKIEEITKPLWGKSLTVDDLIQEGNLGLMLAIEWIASTKKVITVEELQKQIFEAVLMSVNEQSKEKEGENGVADKLNKVLDAIDYFTKELERELDINELAIYLDMPVEEIEDLLRLAGQNEEKAK
jgi:RNA polymerase primary sigma factor